jgi:D-alanyl-lipoteichoic acid acyltransferase DltB (MBOAT superfamily)
MVFSSYQFMFVFLPLTYLAFILVFRFAGWQGAVHVLAAASLAFYAMWGWKLFAVLVVSLAFNYLMSQRIADHHDDKAGARRLMLTGIAANLSLLGYLKYTNFFVDMVNQAAGTGFGHLDLLVPVGVSFYTFIQIGCLVDAYNGQLVRGNFSRYVVFGAFFPCVTAGPLVLQHEIMQQLDGRVDRAFDLRRLVAGLTMFGMGLFKKVAMADTIAPYANTVFDGVTAGAPADFITAWVGATCYALQLYFDFSGYCDMALGVAFIFGIRLPLNFDSPFKASNISDFWRRWHMTMTRFFTTYIYTGLAMNGMRATMERRGGRVEKFLRTAALPSIFTFLVAGVWHGAGWNMALYGLLHGVAIAICLGWREFARIQLPYVVGWGLTMSVVISALVIFRAPDLATAATLLGNMWGLGGFTALGTQALNFDIENAISMIVLFGAVVLLLPNTQQILHNDWVSSDAKPSVAAIEAGLLAWRPALVSSCAMAFAYTVSFTTMGSGGTFLYYQF